MHPAGPTVASRIPAVRPLGGLGVAASTLMVVGSLVWAYTVHVNAWTIFGSIARYRPEGFSGAPFVTETGIIPMKHSIIAVGIATLVCLVAAVVFLCWLRRARVNAELLSSAPHRHGRGWLVGAWFVPFVNLVVPFRIVSDIWLASAPPTEARQIGTAPVLAWWLTALGTWLLYGVAFGLRLDRSWQYTAAVLISLQGLLTVVAAALAVVVVSRIGRWQATR
jgi:hypothetical protein